MFRNLCIFITKQRKVFYFNTGFTKYLLNLNNPIISMQLATIQFLVLAQTMCCFTVHDKVLPLIKTYIQINNIPL